MFLLLRNISADIPTIENIIPGIDKIKNKGAVDDVYVGVIAYDTCIERE